MITFRFRWLWKHARRRLETRRKRASGFRTCSLSLKILKMTDVTRVPVLPEPVAKLRSLAFCRGALNFVRGARRGR